MKVRRANEYDCAWLLIYQDNHRAIEFYDRHGYVEGGTDFVDVEDLRIPFKLLLKSPPAPSRRTGATAGDGYNR